MNKHIAEIGSSRESLMRSFPLIKILKKQQRTKHLYPPTNAGKKNTVDGGNPASFDMIWIVYHDLFIYLRWCWISSINSISITIVLYKDLWSVPIQSLYSFNASYWCEKPSFRWFFGWSRGFRLPPQRCGSQKKRPKGWKCVVNAQKESLDEKADRQRHE